MTKDLLIKMILREAGNDADRAFLDTPEGIAYLKEKWETADIADIESKPDYKRLFDAIRKKTGEGRLDDTIIPLKAELQNLKEKYFILRNRYRIIVAVAASLLMLFTIGSLTYISKTHPFRSNVTESITPNGQKSQLSLPDGTRVFLNSGTILRYDSRFGRQNRRVELVGEAFFEVTPNKKIPFMIYTSDIEIRVVGTKFNVMAYPNEPNIETTVTEGTVNIKDISSDNSMMLTANQKASFTKTNRKLILHTINPLPVISWKENILYFDNENFESVIKKLERWYDVTIHLEGKDSIDDRFTLTIRNESLKEVLDLIKLTTPIRYKVQDKDVIITYKK